MAQTVRVQIDGRSVPVIVQSPVQPIRIEGGALGAANIGLASLTGAVTNAQEAAGEAATQAALAEASKDEAVASLNYFKDFAVAPVSDDPSGVDSADALNTAIAYAVANGAAVDLQGKTWRLDTPVNIGFDNLILRNGVIDATNMAESATNSNGTDFVLYAIGSLAATAHSLTVDAVPDAAYPQTLTIADTSSYAAGDIILIQDDRVWAPVAGRYQGELAQVLAVTSSTVLQLDRPLTYGYLVTADADPEVAKVNGGNAKITKVNVVRNVRLENVEINGPCGPDTVDTTTETGARFRPGVLFRYAADVTLTGCRLKWFTGNGAVTFDTTWMPKFLDGRVADDYGGWYGVLTNSTYGLEVAGSELVNVRHGVSLGGRVGLSLHSNVHHNLFVGCEAAIDAHDGVDWSDFSHNTAIGQGKAGNPHGIIYQGRNFVCVGNRITGYLANGIIWQGLTDNQDPAIIQITGNVIDTTNVSAASLAGVIVQTSRPNVTVGAATIDNTVSGPWGYGCRIHAAGGAINNVQVRGTYRGHLLAGVYVHAANAAIDTLLIDAILDSTATYGVQVAQGASNAISNLALRGCIKGVTSYGLYFPATGAVTGLEVDAAVSGFTTAGVFVRAQSANVDGVVIRGLIQSSAALPGVRFQTDATYTLSNARVDADIRGTTVPILKTNTGTMTNVKMPRQRGLATLTADSALTVLSQDCDAILDTATLTAARVLTLSTTNAFEGMELRYSRTGGGAFNRTVAGKGFATNTWGLFRFDGTAWALVAYGTLI